MSALSTVIARGLLSARAAAGNSGRTYFATDTGLSYRDNGSSWDKISDVGGTSMPASPATNDHFWRTDLGETFVYDGTRWLCTGLHDFVLDPDAARPASATQSAWASAPILNGTDIWLVKTWTWFYVVAGTALSGSHKWVGVLVKQPLGTTLDTVTIASGATDTHRQSAVTTIGALLTSSTQFAFSITFTKTGTPGNLYYETRVSYLHVAT